MDDLGQAKNRQQEVYMLGGGNPGAIPEMEKLFRAELELLLAEDKAFEQLVGQYDAPQGNTDFLSVASSASSAPVFQLVLMIQPLKVHHVPLIYSRQVNFVIFSFKTAV